MPQIALSHSDALFSRVIFATSGLRKLDVYLLTGISGSLFYLFKYITYECII